MISLNARHSPHRQRGNKPPLRITTLPLTDNQLPSFSAICTLPAQNGVFNYKESHTPPNSFTFVYSQTGPDDVQRGHSTKENTMFTFLLKSFAIACGTGIILILPFLFANTQRLSSTPPNKTVRVSTPRSTTKRTSLTQEREAEVLFQETEFYRTIINNNLFRPLGWTPPRQKESFRLLGTRIPTDGKTSPQAIIQATQENKTYIVTTNDTLSKDTTVTDIQSKQVTLEKSGHQRTLKLSTTVWLK